MEEAARTITIPAELPYDPFRTSLYTRDELMDGWQPGNPAGSLDGKIERHVLNNGFRAPPAPEALAQRLHDHAVDVALAGFLADKPRPVVGIMGSAAARRDDPWYRQVVELSWLLTRAGFLVASGGGPGMMEAANLGAFLAPHSNHGTLDDAVEALSDRPAYESDSDDYVRAAIEARERFGPDGGESIAIPTWFYAGEPLGQFPSHIAKYFANSIREDGLLSIAVSGIVFAPGRAGTLQELFQDAAQNAYGIKGPSPMVLLGSEHYASDPSIYDLLRAQARRYGGFDGLVKLCDDPHDAVEFVAQHQPREALEGLVGKPDEVLAFLRNERMRVR